MIFPLSYLDVSLIIAVIAIILFVTSEMLSSYYGKVDMLIDKKKLRNASVAVLIIFLITMALRIIAVVVYP